MRNRFSWRNLVLIFVACAFPVHLYALIIVLYALPSWVIRMTAWELVGALSYPLLAMLVESVIVTLFALAAVALAPRRWGLNKTIALGTLWLWIFSLWAVVVQINYPAITDGGLRLLLPWLALAALTFAAGLLLVWRFEKTTPAVITVLERLTVLVAAYLVFDLAGVLVVLIRNVSG
jgi:hypothetical protein